MEFQIPHAFVNYSHIQLSYTTFRSVWLKMKFYTNTLPIHVAITTVTTISKKKKKKDGYEDAEESIL